MALTNFSLPFGALGQPWGVTLAPLHPIHQLASNTNNLLYSPADHQQQQPQQQSPADSNPEFYKNNPYAPPQPVGGYQYQNTGNRRKQNNNNNAYLPPTAPNSVRNSVYHIQQQVQQVQQQDHQENSVSFQSSSSRSSSASGQSSIQLTTQTRGPAEGSYSRFPAAGQQQQQQQQQPQQKQYFNAHGSASATFTKNSGSFSITSFGSRQPPQQQKQQPPQPQLQQPLPPAPPPPRETQRSRQAKPEAQPAQTYGVAPPDNYPERAPGFTRVQAGQGSRTQVHAVLDYDVEEGEEEDEEEEDGEEGQYYEGQQKDKANNNNQMPTVTPIQGPIFLKNGTVPVVPLFSYPKLNNGSFLQIPIWWTALSVALGLDVRGDVIKGVPCIKRYHQLFCPTAGNSYPIEKIERFIDDNKALMRRMYGDFEMNMEGPGGGGGGRQQQAKVRKRRFIDEPDIFIPPGAFAANVGEAPVEAGDSYFGQLRKKRQAAAGGSRNRGNGAGGAGGGGSGGNSNANRTPGGNGNSNSGTGRLDACESKIEIVTPYWASNSAGKIRAIVNTQHFEQAIHQEVCSNTQTPRCEGECGCEQKYKWHRLLAYDPDNDCKGIFMDWFLFPSCCVCRCNP
ncbi:hypothetical protein KR038_010055 [Drosophila bunnanda]|nr:hypothetical protein KR038_010055 [Drosophila bunnanda]